jgi:hypothetical protein
MEKWELPFQYWKSEFRRRGWLELVARPRDCPQSTIPTTPAMAAKSSNALGHRCPQTPSSPRFHVFEALSASKSAPCLLSTLHAIALTPRALSRDPFRSSPSISHSHSCWRRRSIAPCQFAGFPLLLCK